MIFTPKKRDTKKRGKTEIMISPEFNLVDAFSETNIASLLSMWEGKGGAAQGNLY